MSVCFDSQGSRVPAEPEQHQPLQLQGTYTRLRDCHYNIIMSYSLFRRVVCATQYCRRLAVNQDRRWRTRKTGKMYELYYIGNTELREFHDDTSKNSSVDTEIHDQNALDSIDTRRIATDYTKARWLIVFFCCHYVFHRRRIPDVYPYGKNLNLPFVRSRISLLVDFEKWTTFSCTRVRKKVVIINNTRVYSTQSS